MSPDDQRSTAALEVVVTDERGRRLRKPALVGWLRSVAPARARGTLCVAFVSDAAMRRLNRQFAGHDYVTDVLSFPANDEVRPSTRARGALSSVEGRKSESPRVRPSDSRTARRSTTLGPSDSRTLGLSPRHLGDIVIATNRAARQALEARHALQTELRILALHGLLHVLGYDHAGDQGQMARLEARLRRKGGLQAGLIERAGLPSKSREPRAQSRKRTAQGRRLRA